HHARGGEGCPPPSRPHPSGPWILRAPAPGDGSHALMPTVRSLPDELSALLARTLSLGEDAAHVLARISAVPLALRVGWLGYRILVVVIPRLLRPLEGSTNYPVRAQRARTLGPLLTSVTRYMMAFVVFVVILQQIGIDVGSLLVSAGVVGIVIGL